MSATSENQFKFSLSFLLPKYWSTWLLLLLLRILTFLPRRVVMFFGAWVGDQFRKRNKKRRRIVEVNLALCFPEMSDAEREQLCIDHFRAYGRSLADMGFSIWGSKKKLKKLVTFEGLDEHKKVVQESNVLVITWHLTTLEVTGNVFCLAGPSVSMFKPIKNSLITWQLAKGRCHLGDVDLILREQGMRPLMRSMRQGRQGFFVPDEDFSADSNKAFVPFFATQRALLTTPSRLIRSVKGRVVVAASRLIPETGRYVCTILPPLEAVQGLDHQADAELIAESMEQLIRLAPEQYMWTFRWFRSRPDGSPSPYDPV